MYPHRILLGLVHSNKYIVMDLINSLPSNISVNTAQHAKIEDAVFSLDLTDAPVDWLDSDHVICVSSDACPFRGYTSKSPGGFRAVTSE
jgi:hypothetical protein